MLLAKPKKPQARKKIPAPASTDETADDVGDDEVRLPGGAQCFYGHVQLSATSAVRSYYAKHASGGA